MVGKCKLCCRIFIRDIDHARKIETYFKVRSKGIEGYSISMLMNETNVKSVALNIYYLVDDFSLAENLGELFVEICLVCTFYFCRFISGCFWMPWVISQTLQLKTICLSMKLKRSLEKLGGGSLVCSYCVIVKQVQSSWLFWTLYSTLVHLSICFIPIGLILIITRKVLRYWI